MLCTLVVHYWFLLLIYHLVDTSPLLLVFLFWLFTSRFMVSYILVSWKQKYLWDRWFEQSWFYHHVCDPCMTDMKKVVSLQVSPEYGLWWSFRILVFGIPWVNSQHRWYDQCNCRSVFILVCIQFHYCTENIAYVCLCCIIFQVNLYSVLFFYRIQNMTENLVLIMVAGCCNNALSGLEYFSLR